MHRLPVSCTIIIIITISMATTPTTRAEDKPEFQFQIRQSVSLSNTSLPPTATLLHTLRFQSTLSCAKSCGHNTQCLSFYTHHIAGDTDGRQTCKLYSDRVLETGLLPGTGTYGYLEKFTLPNDALPPVPQLRPGVPYSLARTKHGTAAVYGCSSGNTSTTTINILYHHDANQWFELSQNCRSSLCDQDGLGDILLNISKSGTMYNAQAFCQEGEDFHSNAQCDELGTWTAQSPLLDGCCSNTCYRRNANRKAFYSGTVTVSKTGIVCQNWDSQSPHTHHQIPASFHEDGQDMAAAQNYCRDPDSEGAPWCYLMTGPDRWGYCDIPRCPIYEASQLD